MLRLIRKGCKERWVLNWNGRSLRSVGCRCLWDSIGGTDDDTVICIVRVNCVYQCGVLEGCRLDDVGSRVVRHARVVFCFYVGIEFWCE